MSIQQAQLWLKNHSSRIPALRVNYLNIIEHLEQENSAHEIILCASADPGFSLALLSKINRRRGTNSTNDSVESTKSAIALLGNQVIHNLLKEFETAEDKLTKPHQTFLFQQLINRSFHNEFQVSKWAKENGYQHIEQLKSTALLNYAGEILCCVHDFEHYLKYIHAGGIEGDEIKYFKFCFSQLTEALCQQQNLAKILINSQPHNKSTNQREIFLLLIATLSKQCEHGWYSQPQHETFQKFADFLQHPVDLVISKFHQFSVLAAHQTIIPEAWQPASRLILIQDKAWAPPVTQKVKIENKPTTTETPEEVIKKEIVKQDLAKQVSKAPVTSPVKETVNEPVKVPLATVKISPLESLKQLVKQPKVSQTDILNACLNGLHSDYSMSKVGLLLLSKDKKKLQNRISLGLEKGSPFRQFQIEVAKSGMLKILLNKPQSIWVNSSNFKKYQKIIPQSLLVNIKTTKFLAMSLFIGEKPIGIIYADRTGSTKEIDEKSFKQYQQLITLTSKALTFLAKK